jgi:hypothetical protein
MLRALASVYFHFEFLAESGALRILYKETSTFKREHKQILFNSTTTAYIFTTAYFLHLTNATPKTYAHGFNFIFISSMYFYLSLP